MEIIAYIYLTLAAALNAQAQIDAAFGIPTNGNAVTQHWDGIYKAENINGDTIFYIRYDAAYESILGQPDTVRLAPEAEAVKVNPAE